MKNLRFVFVILLVSLFSIISAQDTTPPTPQKGKVKFETLIHDFGTIDYNGNGTCDFVFKNVGNIPIKLDNVKSSCGCTIPVWPKEPIPAGEESSIKVKYNTKRVGAFNKSITVFLNTDNSPIILKIKGTVKPQVVE